MINSKQVLLTDKGRKPMSKGKSISFNIYVCMEGVRIVHNKILEVLV